MLTPFEIAAILIAAATLAGLGLFEHFNERDRAAAEQAERERR